MNRIFVDLDGVLVDFDGYKQRHDLTAEAVKQHPGAYLAMDAYPGALEAVRELIEIGFEVWIASKPPTAVAGAYADKVSWVLRELPELQKRIILTHDKGLLGDAGDYLCDDFPHKANCEAFPGMLLRFTNGFHWPQAMEFFRRVRLSPRAASVPTHPMGFIKPDCATHVFFYEQDFYVLSNFSSFSLEWRGGRFDTVEAAYHWEKFPNWPQIRSAIAAAPSAHEAFQLARANSDKRRPDWDEVKVVIMLELLRSKVDQHEYVKRKLLATGARILVEDSWRDDFWGWGPDREGRNVLGQLWMRVRSELRGETSPGSPLSLQ